jgi:hypothetical protein
MDGHAQARTHARLMEWLPAFVDDEQAVGQRQLGELSHRAITEKLQTGWPQRLMPLQRAGDPATACAGRPRFADPDVWT